MYLGLCLLHTPVSHFILSFLLCILFLVYLTPDFHCISSFPLVFRSLFTSHASFPSCLVIPSCIHILIYLKPYYHRISSFPHVFRPLFTSHLIPIVSRHSLVYLCLCLLHTCFPFYLGFLLSILFLVYLTPDSHRISSFPLVFRSLFTSHLIPIVSRHSLVCLGLCLLHSCFPLYLVVPSCI